MKHRTLQLQKNHKGFTLMEVMVSVSIFAIIITIGIGSLLTIYSTLKKTRADQQAMDSLSFVMDTMTRRIRTGFNYTGGGSSISFTDQDGENIKYESAIDPNNGDLQRLFFTGSDGIAYDITPENINISAFDLEIYPNTGPGSGQPMVEIHIEGTIKNGRSEVPLSLQTIVSQRPFASGSSGGPIIPGSPTSIINGGASELLNMPAVEIGSGVPAPAVIAPVEVSAPTTGTITAACPPRQACQTAKQ